MIGHVKKKRAKFTYKITVKDELITMFEKFIDFYHRYIFFLPSHGYQNLALKI